MLNEQALDALREFVVGVPAQALSAPLIQMTDEVSNLILEHLKRFQAGQDRIERRLGEVVTRLSSLEHQMAQVHVDIAGVRVDIAGIHTRIDNLSNRVERIERRLDLADTN